VFDFPQKYNILRAESRIIVNEMLKSLVEPSLGKIVTLPDLLTQAKLYAVVKLFYFSSLV